MKEFKKEDLRTGMIAEFRNGVLGLFINTTFITMDNGGLSLDFYENNLIATKRGKKDDDVMRIYNLKTNAFFNASMYFWLGEKNFLDNAMLLWERKEIPEYTMEELAEKLGHEFKIKK